MRASVTYGLARRGGRLGCELAVALDLALATGPRYLLRRRGQERRLAEAYPGLAVNREIWEDAAARVGAELRDLGGGRFELARGGARAVVEMHVPPIDSAEARELALDKAATHRLLGEAGVPLPEQARFAIDDPGPALRRVAEGGSWVVKPAGGTASGQGTTTGVRDGAALRRAAARARRSGREMLLERQAEGDEYRLLLLDGEAIGAVRREPPRVRGDGRSSVAELVLAANERRLAAAGRDGITIVNLDLDALLALERQGLTPRSVPAAGEEVEVKGSRSQAGAAEAETVPLEAVGEGLIAEARAAADALGLRLAGIDLATPDLGSSLREAGGAVIEVNGTPGLHYHYLVRDPERAQRVAVPILERLLA